MLNLQKINKTENYNLNFTALPFFQYPWMESFFFSFVKISPDPLLPLEQPVAPSLCLWSAATKLLIRRELINMDFPTDTLNAAGVQ